MKNKLLIALGDSFTAGWGNYNPEKLNIFLNKNSQDRKEHFSELLNSSESRFLEYSWPNILKHKMLFNEVINLGLGGSSVSGQMKRFISEYGNTNFNDKYDVTLIWLVPTAERISFFINGGVEDIQLSSPKYDKLLRELINTMENPELDFILESNFYIKLMEYFCQLKNYKFYFDFVYKFNNSKGVSYLTHPSYLNIDHPNFNYNNTAFCGHYNELGYTELAKSIQDNLLRKNNI